MWELSRKDELLFDIIKGKVYFHMIGLIANQSLKKTLKFLVESISTMN